MIPALVVAGRTGTGSRSIVVIRFIVIVIRIRTGILFIRIVASSSGRRKRSFRRQRHYWIRNGRVQRFRSDGIGRMDRTGWQRTEDDRGGHSDVFHLLFFRPDGPHIRTVSLFFLVFTSAATVRREFQIFHQIIGGQSFHDDRMVNDRMEIEMINGAGGRIFFARSGGDGRQRRNGSGRFHFFQNVVDIRCQRRGGCNRRKCSADGREIQFG